MFPEKKPQTFPVFFYFRFFPERGIMDELVVTYCYRSTHGKIYLKIPAESKQTIGILSACLRQDPALPVSEDFPEQVGGASCRILADLELLFGDHREHSVNGLAGDIIRQV